MHLLQRLVMRATETIDRGAAVRRAKTEEVLMDHDVLVSAGEAARRIRERGELDTYIYIGVDEMGTFAEVTRERVEVSSAREVAALLRALADYVEGLRMRG